MNGTIMLVEDNRELSNLYDSIISMNGFEIIFKAYDGVEAVNYYKTIKNYPDVILMDYRMPRKNGYDTCVEILELNPNQKIILATADEDIKENINKLGIRQFKKKPFSFDYLISNINKAITQVKRIE